MNKYRFVLLVTSAPYQNHRAYSACQFAYALMKQEHQLKCIFFYDDGVINSNPLLVRSESERLLIQDWQTLAHEHKIPLLICSSDAIKRGLFSSQDAKPIVTPGFIIAGLGQLFAALKDCDRFIVF